MTLLMQELKRITIVYSKPFYGGVIMYYEGIYNLWLYVSQRHLHCTAFI